MQTYLFYDIETTGLNKAFDQLLQFAAIRTDLHLQEIERYELKIKLNPDVIPAPRAILTHHIGIKEAQEGISELEAIQQIHQWLNTPGTISLGYNTLGFDDEFLRFAFYRHLLSPYTHQFANLCSRMDIFPMAVMYFLFKNNVIQWPRLNDKTSLKLEEINKLNQFATGRSHQAMVDVEATIALAKCFHADKQMWQFVAGYFNKQQDQRRTEQHSKEPCILVDSFFGTTSSYQSPVIYLGNHRHYKNQSMWLRLDNEELANIDVTNIEECTYVTYKKTGEPGFVIPFKDHYLQHLSSDRIERAQENFAKLKQNPELFSQIVNYHSNYLYPTHPHVDTQASLYLQGFFSDLENQFCRQFHHATHSDKSALTERISSPRIKELAIRLLGKYYPDTLTPSQEHHFQQYLQQLNPSEGAIEWSDYQGEKRLTIPAALKEIETLRIERKDQNELRLLDELERHLKEIKYCI